MVISVIFLRRMFVWFFFLIDPVSKRANPAYMKNTKAADTKAYIVSTVAKASVTSSKTVF